MIFGRLRDGFCRVLCPHHDQTKGEDRLDRAERHHIMSAAIAATESHRTGVGVGYMRTVANSAVDRLRHERIEVEGAEE